jgi:hypothetical protein
MAGTIEFPPTSGLPESEAAKQLDEIAKSLHARLFDTQSDDERIAAIKRYICDYVKLTDPKVRYTNVVRMQERAISNLRQMLDEAHEEIRTLRGGENGKADAA